MSDTHGSPTTGDHDDHDQHDDHDLHAHADGAAHGPVDVMAWGAGAVGILLGLVVAACFALSTGAISAV